MPSRQFARLLPIVVAIAIPLALPGTANAQRPDRGLFDTLRSADVRADLNLDDATLEKIAAIEKGVGSVSLKEIAEANPDVTGGDELRNLKEQEEANLRAAAETKVRAILGSKNSTRLDQLALQRAGIRGLLKDEVAEELELSDEVREELELLVTQQQEEFRRKLGFGAKPEDLAALKEEWDAKFLAVLDDDQQAAWEAKIGEPMANAPSKDGGDRSKPVATTPKDPTESEVDPQGDDPSKVAGVDPAETEPGETGTPATKPNRTVERVPEGAKVSASFGDSSEKRGPAQKFSFNFKYAPWDEVLELFAEAAGLNLDPGAIPEGTFNYIDANTYDATEALDVLNGYLMPKGYALVRRDEFLVAIDLTAEIPPNLVPHVLLERLGDHGKNELVSVVIPLSGEKANPKQTAEEVKAVLGEYGKADPLSSANAIVVRDTAGNAMRIARWLTGIEDFDPNALSFKKFTLEYITCVDAAPILKEQLGVTAGVKNVSAGVRGFGANLGNGGPPGTQFVQPGGRGGGDDDRRRMFMEMIMKRRQEEESRNSGGSSGSSSSSAASSSKIKISLDVRTNSLLVTATTPQLMLAEKILEAIDVPPDGAYEPVESSGPYLKVYKVDNTDAGEVAKTLSAIQDGVVINEDRSAKTVHIWGDDEVQRWAANMIRELDGLGSSQQVTVIPLSRMDPLAAATTIRSMFYKDGDNAPTVEADLYGRQLIIRASIDQVTQIKSMLAQLGEDGSGAGREGPLGDGPIRSIPIQGRDPEELIPLIEKLWNASNEQTIRIVPNERPTVRRRFPSDRPERSSLRGERLPGRDLQLPSTGVRPREETPSATTPAVESPDSPAARVQPSKSDTQPVLFRDPADESSDETTSRTAENTETAPAETAPAAPAAESEPVAAPEAPAAGSAPRPIALSLNGEAIVVMSNDEKALDRLEMFIDTLSRAMPPSNQWNVFYLQAADATETAELLSQLIPDASVSNSLSGADAGLMGSLTSGITSMGSSLMDMSGLDAAMAGPNVLRIVPDVRSNSLFVTGPSSLVKKVEDLLAVLDEDDLPDSLRDRQPGMIPVEHADVDDVAEIVREIYKDFMGGGQQGGGGGQINPLQMMMAGAGGGKQKGAQKSDVRLTLSVDSRTSQLIVSASDSLFREIQALVRRLDEDALIAKHTTQVVPLEYANTLLVQNALTSLIPKVRVGSTSTSRPKTASTQPGSTPQTNNGGGGDSDEKAQQDAMRKMFEQRMRERMQQGGGGGGAPAAGGGRPGGGRTGGGRPGGGFGGFGGFGGRGR